MLQTNREVTAMEVTELFCFRKKYASEQLQL